MELLVIGKEDFNRIFMNDNDEEESEHVKFLRQVPIMQNWPMDCLRDEPGTCILHYFKRGSLVTEDGKKSEWLYFIKSGSCEVLKKLKNVKARKSCQIKRKPDPITEIVLPELGGGPECKVDTGQRRRKHKIYMNTDVFQDMANYYEALRRIMPTSAMLKKDEPPKQKVGSEEEDCTKNDSVFVKLALLQSKDVFGLDTLTGWGSEDLDDMLNESPTTCLVSKGAEVVMLSKKVFLKYINESVRNNLRESIRAYPREQKLQENFQNKLDWEDYKSSLVDTVLYSPCGSVQSPIHI